MYVINDQNNQKCELVGKYGIPGQPPKVLMYILKTFLSAFAMPAVFILILGLETGFSLKYLIPLGFVLMIFSLKSLIKWPSFPEKVIFDPESRRVYLIDNVETTLKDSPSMSYEEISQIKVQKRVERNGKRSSTLFYVTLIKKDSSRWQLIGPYRRRIQAENSLDRFLELSEWSIEEDLGENQDNSLQKGPDKRDIGAWSLPQKNNQNKRFTVESLGDYSRINWHIKRPKSRFFALKSIIFAFFLITIGTSQLEGLAVLFSPISLLICFWVFRTTIRFKPEQDIKVFRDYLELSSTGGWKGERTQLYYDQLAGLALDFSKEGLKLRFVRTDDMTKLENSSQDLTNINTGDVFNILKIFVNATYVNTYDLSAGEILILEEIIQDQVTEIADQHLL